VSVKIKLPPTTEGPQDFEGGPFLESDEDFYLRHDLEGDGTTPRRDGNFLTDWNNQRMIQG
jgi:hypothetical protein